MVTIIELPDNVTGAALAMSIAASGMVNARTTALLTVQEVDRAIGNRASLLPRSGDFSLRREQGSDPCVRARLPGAPPPSLA